MSDYNRGKVRDSIDKILGLGGWALGKRKPRAPVEDMGPIQMGADVGKAPMIAPPPQAPNQQIPLDPAMVEKARAAWAEMDMHWRRPYMERAQNPEAAFMAFARDFAQYGGPAR